MPFAAVRDVEAKLDGSRRDRDVDRLRRRRSVHDTRVVDLRRVRVHLEGDRAERAHLVVQADAALEAGAVRRQGHANVRERVHAETLGVGGAVESDSDPVARCRLAVGGVALHGPPAVGGLGEGHVGDVGGGAPGRGCERRGVARARRRGDVVRLVSAVRPRRVHVCRAAERLRRRCGERVLRPVDDGARERRRRDHTVHRELQARRSSSRSSRSRSADRGARTSSRSLRRRRSR